MTDFEELLDAFLKLRRDHEELKNKYDNTFLRGQVVERDHDKGFRLQLGTDEEPDLSDWVQPSEKSGKERDLPELGQQLMIIAPHGDQGQGIGIHYGHTDDRPNPAKHANDTVFYNRDKFRSALDADKKELTVTNDKVTTTTTDKKITDEVEGTKRTTSKEGTDFTEGHVHHDDRDMGKTHKHEGGMLGGGSTDVPEVWT